MEHADLNALADKAIHAPHIDELLIRRLKKRRLQLRDRIARLEMSLTAPEPA
ncbi:MAG: YdcH family protein [Polaromonas sp.]